MKIILRRKDNQEQLRKMLDYKKKITGMKEEDIIVQAVREVSIEGLLFISRIKKRYNENIKK